MNTLKQFLKWRYLKWKREYTNANMSEKQALLSFITQGILVVAFVAFCIYVLIKYSK